MLVRPESVNTHRMRQWSRVVRGIMLANGFGGNFLGNADAVMLSASPEFATWTSAFKEIVVFLQEKAFEGWTAKDVFVVLSFEKEVYAHELDKGVNDGKSFTRMAQGRGILDELIGNQSNDQARRVRVGQLLRSKMGAVYGKLKLIDTHKHSMAVLNSMHYNPRVTMMKATMKVEPPFRPLRGVGLSQRDPHSHRVGSKWSRSGDPHENPLHPKPAWLLGYRL